MRVREKVFEAHGKGIVREEGRECECVSVCVCVCVCVCV